MRRGSTNSRKIEMWSRCTALIGVFTGSGRRPFVVALAALLVACGAGAADVHPTLDLAEVRLEIRWVEAEAEMNRLRRQFGRPPIDTVIRSELAGFSVLGKRDGAYVCLIFARRPTVVDDRLTVTLGHELLHCLLGEYHR